MFKLAGHQILVMEHFSCRRWSDVLRCCSIQTRVVDTPKQFDQAFRRSVVDEQESELVQSRRPVCASDGSHNRCPFGLVAGLLSIANASFKQWTHLCAIVFVVMVNRCLQSSEPFDAQQLWDTGGFDDVGTEPSVRCLHPYERVRTCRRPISQFKRHCSSRFHVDFHLEL